MMTTRRPRGRVDRDRAARRPRPNVERPAEPPLRPNVLPRWPAFFAARITSPTKLFGRLAPWLPWRMRPGRTWRSSSRVVMAARAPANAGDGARSVEIAWKFTAKAPAGADAPNVSKISNPTNHMRPTEGRRFYLAVRWSCSSPAPVRPSNLRWNPPRPDRARPWSWLLIPTRCPHKQAVRLRCERRQILGTIADRRSPSLRIGRCLSGR